MRRATLRNGEPVEIGHGRPGAPPDRPGWMAPAASQLWVKRGGLWWEVIEHQGVRGLVLDLAVCDSWQEVIDLGVVRPHCFTVL